jgi:hypothetical protein
MQFIPLFLQATEYKEYYSIMPGRLKAGGCDRIPQPGRNEPLRIRSSPPPEVPKTGHSRGATLLSCIYDINVMLFYDWAGVMQSGASWAALLTMKVTS